MPYADPDKRRQAKRESARRRRAKDGTGLGPLAQPPAQSQGTGEDAEGLPDPPTRDEMLRALGVQAREGNVPAIRLLLEEYRRDGDSDEKPKRSFTDELAARRARGA
jgi:hypothetical protein